MSTTENVSAEYFIFDRKGDQAFPLLRLAPGIIKSPFREEKPIDDKVVVPLTLGKPVPRKPVMGDFLMLTPIPIICKKIYDLLQPLNIQGIQLIPVQIEGKEGEKYDGYYAMHSFHFIKAMDKEKSEYKEDYGGGYTVKRFLLDEKVMQKIPLEERLIFRLDESSSCVLFHQSIVGKIMALEPTGVKFTPVVKWVL